MNPADSSAGSTKAASTDTPAQQDEMERLRAQLGGVSTAALGWNDNPAKQGDWGWSQAYQDVLDLRAKYERLQADYVKATAAPAAQEPVAWIWHYRDGHRSLRWSGEQRDWNHSDVPDSVTRLYAAPVSMDSETARITQLETALQRMLSELPEDSVAYDIGVKALDKVSAAEAGKEPVEAAVNEINELRGRIIALLVDPLAARIVDHVCDAAVERQSYVHRVPEGWALVPIEPTQGMCQAGQEKAREWPKFPLRISPIYNAMLRAVATDGRRAAGRHRDRATDPASHLLVGAEDGRQEDG